jgi:nucleolar protein 58
MAAIAPNLTCMVGELVGARLIAHAGSLINLAKHPASTVQILGAEKALFRALKTKHATPKYGLIYHASLVGQSAPKHKGKIARVLAAKSALCARVDALGDHSGVEEIGIRNRSKVEQRLQQLEGRVVHRVSGTGRSASGPEKYESKTKVGSYNASADAPASLKTEEKKEKKKDKESKEKTEEKKDKEHKSDDKEKSKDKGEKEKKEKKDKEKKHDESKVSRKRAADDEHDSSSSSSKRK